MTTVTLSYLDALEDGDLELGEVVRDEQCEQHVIVRVDCHVEQYGAKYLAEVTTGKAADPKNVSTWRQLFEYAAKGVSRVAEETLAAGYNVAPKVNLANPKDKPFRQRVGPAAKIIEADKQRIFRQFLAEP